jgi:hypothetical protein
MPFSFFLMAMDQNSPQPSWLLSFPLCAARVAIRLGPTGRFPRAAQHQPIDHAPHSGALCR